MFAFLSLSLLCPAVLSAAAPQGLYARQSQAFVLEDVTSSLLDNEYSVDFTFTDPNTGTETSCQTLWYVFYACFAFACTRLTYFPRSSSSPAPSDVIFCSDTSFDFQLNPFIGTNNFTLYVSHSTDSLYGFTYLYGSAPWEPSSGPLDCAVPEPGGSVCQATSVSVPIS